MYGKRNGKGREYYNKCKLKFEGEYLNRIRWTEKNIIDDVDEEEDMGYSEKIDKVCNEKIYNNFNKIIDIINLTRQNN